MTTVSTETRVIAAFSCPKCGRLHKHELPALQAGAELKVPEAMHIVFECACGVNGGVVDLTLRR